MVEDQAVVQVRLVQTPVIPLAMLLLPLQVARDARQDAQAVAPAHVVAVAHLDVRVPVVVAVRVHAAAGVLQVVQQDAKALAVRDVRQVAPENALILVEQGAQPVVQGNVAVDAHQVALMDVKRPVPETVLMVAIPYAAADANILVEGRVNMFPQALLVPAVQGHVALIVITLVAWHVVQAACLAAYLHQSDV